MPVNCEEVMLKSDAVKKCGDILEIVSQIVSLAPDRETALEAIAQVGEAIKTE